MEKQYPEKCPSCEAEIWYSENEQLIKCCSCGNTFRIAEFVREQQKIEQRLAEGEKAKEDLKTAKLERQMAQEALSETVQALEGIQLDQQVCAENVKRILEGQNANRTMQDNMMSLLRSLQGGQKYEKSFLNHLLKNVSVGQQKTEDKLTSISEITEELLLNQNRTDDMINVLNKRIAGSEQERKKLIAEFVSWSRYSRKEDFDRLKKIRDYSEKITNAIKEIDTRIDQSYADISRVENAVKEFETKWENDRRNKLVKKYKYAEVLQKERRFDEALEYYKEVLINGGQDLEVYWRILMCHYCIEYQWDDEGNQIPTILYPDLSDPSEVTERVYLLDALQDAEKEVQEYYKSKLNDIDSILDKYRQWQYKHEYDVFISVKQTARSNGQKYYTNDYRVGLELYEHLTSLGLKVFNSEKTKGPAGREWEPYILAALMSARIMIVVGTCPEYMEAQWVKNEWSRYQWLQKYETDRNRKRLLFCYLSGGMRAECIPKGLNPGRQAIIDGIGAREELDEAIYRVFPRIEKERTKRQPFATSSHGQQTEAAIISRMEELLVNEEYEKVERVYEEYRNQEDHNNVSVSILLRVLCAQLRVGFVEDIPHTQVLLSEQKFFRLAKNCANRANDSRLLEQLKQMETDNLAELKKKEPKETKLPISDNNEIKNNGGGTSFQLPKQATAEQKKDDNAAPDTTKREEGKITSPQNPAKLGEKSKTEHTINKKSKDDSGTASALYHLGNRYMHGWDIEQDQEKAVFCYRMSADEGNIDAVYMLGGCYYCGNGVEQDYAKAAYYYEKSAAQGHAAAQFNLGMCYIRGEGVEEDCLKGISYLQKAAQQGTVEAQVYLGVIYEDGVKVKQDYKKAVSYYQQAADQGDAFAEFSLANCYFSGLGVEQDYKKAMLYYKKEADRGLADGQNKLGDCYYCGTGVEQDYKKAVSYYKKAADQGNADAQKTLGECYENGRGVTANIDEAVRLYRLSANQGNKIGQHHLAKCYEKGKGVPRDYHEAFCWYTKSAEQGYKYSQNEVGWACQHGIGVDKNVKEAVRWYRKAVEQGLAEAQSNLGICYMNGDGVEKDYSQGIALFVQSARQGGRNGQYNLGWCYEKGQGVQQSYTEAFRLFLMSAEQNYAPAQYQLGCLYINGWGVEQDKNTAYLYYRKAANQGFEPAVEAIRKMK